MQQINCKTTAQGNFQKLGYQSLYFPLWGDFLSVIKQFDTAGHLPLLITCKVKASRHKWWRKNGFNDSIVHASWMEVLSETKPCLNLTVLSINCKELKPSVVLNVRPSHWLPAKNIQALKHIQKNCITDVTQWVDYDTAVSWLWHSSDSRGPRFGLTPSAENTFKLG